MNSNNTPNTQAQSSPVSVTAEQILGPIFGQPLTRSVVSGSKLSLDYVTVGILTALPHEFETVCTVLQCGEDAVAMRDGGDKVYRLGEVSGKPGKWGYVVAVATLNDMGNVSAATRVANMLNDCKYLQALIVCGVAGAVPSPTSPADHVRIGDIVVSVDGVIQYDFGKQYANGFVINGSPYRPSYTLIAAVKSLQGKVALGERPWEKYIETCLASLPSHFRRPAAETDLLCEANWSDLKSFVTNVKGWMRQHLKSNPDYPPIQHPTDPDRKIGQPRIFYGLIASASVVQKDPGLRDRLRKKYNVKAVEMEAAGAAHACYARNVGYLAVRGTCDYCNPDKNKIWQPYAVLAAAAYTRSLLEEIDVHVFSSTPKILTVVRTTAAMEHIEDVQATFPGKYSEQALNEIERQTRDGVVVQQTALERQLLTAEGERYIAQVKEFIETWEFENAFLTAATAAAWIANNETSVSSLLVGDIYAILARVEAIRVKRSRGDAGAVDLKLARQYLSKAKDAYNR